MNYEERIKARDVIRSHEGFRAHWRIVGHDAVWQAFCAGTQTLLEGCTAASTELEALERDEPSKAREWMFRLQPRLLSWLLSHGAPLQLLTDYSRTLARDLLDDRQHASYQAHVDSSFVASPEMQVLSGLRNFVQHNDVPILQIYLFDVKGGDRILLPRNKLLKHKGPWPSSAKQYLQQEGEPINVAQLAREYQDRASALRSELRAGCIAHSKKHLLELYALYDDVLESAKADGASFEDILVVRHVS